MSEECIQANWASWALLQEASNDNSTQQDMALRFCRDRLQKLFGTEDPGPRCKVVMTADGHWGRGRTLKEAAQTAVKAGARKTSKAHIFQVLNDATPEINEYGYTIVNSDAELIDIGTVRTLGSLIVD